MNDGSFVDQKHSLKKKYQPLQTADNSSRGTLTERSKREFIGRKSTEGYTIHRRIHHVNITKRFHENRFR